MTRRAVTPATMDHYANGMRRDSANLTIQRYHRADMERTASDWKKEVVLSHTNKFSGKGKGRTIKIQQMTAKNDKIHIKPAQMNFLLTATSYVPPAMMTTKVKVSAVLVVLPSSSSSSSSSGGQQQQATTKMENS